MNAACRASRADKLAALRSTLARLNTAADRMAAEQRTLRSEIDANVATLNSRLRDEVNQYTIALYKFSAAFQAAIAQVSGSSPA